MDNDKKYTVFVGGGEVNSYLVTLEEAEDIAQGYEDDGYDDVSIEEVA